MNRRNLIIASLSVWALMAAAAGQTVPIVVSQSANCATSVDGTVVGLPNPLQVPQVATIGSGSLGAGTYYIEIAWYDSTGAITLVSSEVQKQLVSTGSLQIQPPANGLPQGAIGMKVYIGATSGAETLQGTTVSSAPFLQSTALVTGAAVPSTNTTLCEIVANDAGWPSGTGYRFAVTSPSGVVVPGYPSQVQLLGPGQTINVGNGLPLYNGTVTYPIPILARPYNHGGQSISGPLSMTGYKLTQVSYLGIGTSLPAWGVDAEVPAGGSSLEGAINAKTGYLVNGGAGTVGQGLCSNGSYLNSFCNFLTSLPTFYYQTVAAAGTAKTQRPVINFSNRFTLADSASPARTNVDLNAPGSGQYVATYGSLPGATHNCAQYDGSGNLEPSGQDCFNGSATLRDYYWTETDPCSSGSGNSVACESGGFAVLTTHLPGTMPDASYTVSCSPDTHTFSIHPPSLSCGFINANDGQPTYSLPTTPGGNLYFQVVQILDNGGSGGSPVVYFHAHHD